MRWTARLVFASLLLVLASCGSGVSTSTTGPADSTAATTPSVSPRLNVVATVPEAIAINVASNGDDAPVVAWVGPSLVEIARIDLDSSSLIDRQEISGDFEPFAHPIERPGLAIRPDGTIDLAFTATEPSGGSVYYSSIGKSTPAPEPISGAARPETNLVHIGVDPSGDTAIAWLEDSTLSVATVDGANQPVEHENVDDRTCDCCNPAPVFAGESLLVPYRDYALVDGEVTRDTVSVRTLDGGATFEEPVAVADEHWFIDACPFSGPSAVAIGDTVVVAFMDARQTVHPDQRTSSIWIDISQDAGATFGTDHQVSTDGINRWPVMAVDDEGAIHLVWELDGPEGGLMYSVSGDEGATFSDPIVLLSEEDTSGSPRSPSVAFYPGTLLVTWTDSDGGHLGLLDL